MNLVAELLDDEEEEKLLWELLTNRPLCLSADRAVRGGSRPGRAPNKLRQYHARHVRLMEQYFNANPVYNSSDFRRRYRMSRRLFDKVLSGVQAVDAYFIQRPNAARRVGISGHLKVTAALRVLAYATSYDSLDEGLEMGESTINLCLKNFCIAVLAAFEPEFLRPPRPEEVHQLLEQNARRGFLGMVGSIDCMHWQWKNCPVYVAGMHKGKAPKPTKVLEAVADYNLRIWHCNFGSPGSLNDINILDQSPLFHTLLRGENATVCFEINGHTYDTPYFLADGIYPNWPVFVKSIEHPRGAKRQHYTRRQESCRKDVERCFGVLKARWHILETPCRLWSEESLDIVMRACIVLHNMIVEDEKEVNASIDSTLYEPEMPAFVVSRPPPFSDALDITGLIVRTTKLHSKTKHAQLREDLVEHLWSSHGE